MGLGGRIENLIENPMAQSLENTIANIEIEISMGRYHVKTLSNSSELRQAFLLRYQVFQVEMIGHGDTAGEDQDAYDSHNDHLGIFDTKTEQLVATCRLNCSLFSNEFYTAQEFHCEELIARPEIKVEIGRVCVHRDFRKGVIIILLWRAIADYMTKSKGQILFGCGSVMTESPSDAILLYRFLDEDQKVRTTFPTSPKTNYRSSAFDTLLLASTKPLSPEQREAAKALLPPLCKSYFEMGCYITGIPAFDREFKCIDFLTILEMPELDGRIRQKMMGS